MKILSHIAQNTPAWTKWREGGLGASDASSITSGSGKHMALYMLKTGQMPESALVNDFENYWMARGHELEPVARLAYEEQVKDFVEPVCVEHDDYPWLRASLDGLSSDGTIPIEIKCCGKEKHGRAVKTKTISPAHWPQCQHILLVTGAPFLHYFAFDGEEGVIVVVKADLPYQGKYLERAEYFWDCVTNRTPPTLEKALRASIQRAERQEAIG